MSRWTSPTAWAAATPAASWLTRSRPTRIGGGPTLLEQAGEVAVGKQLGRDVEATRMVAVGVDLDDVRGVEGGE